MPGTTVHDVLRVLTVLCSFQTLLWHRICLYSSLRSVCCPDRAVSIEEGQIQNRLEPLWGLKPLGKNKLKHHSALHSTVAVLGNEWRKIKCMFIWEVQSREAFREENILLLRFAMSAMKLRPCSKALYICGIELVAIVRPHPTPRYWEGALVVCRGALPLPGI